MKKNVFIVAAITAFIASSAVAQVSAFNGQDAAIDAVDDLEEAIEDERERDLGSFGNEGREIGNYGSLALRGTSVQSGDNSTSDVGIGVRYGTYDGINGIDITASLSYGETDGEATKDTLIAGADYRRNLTDSTFAYGQLVAAFDNLAELDEAVKQDVFVGAGLGYRIYNSADTQWSIQAGPGYRTAKVVGQDDVEEAAASASSNIFRSLSDSSYVTNDTDVIYSETLTTINNELALNVAMTNTLSLRTSVTSVFNAEQSIDEGVNTFGISVIYNFE
jgi:putative salt-induced outer membrane protein